VRQLKENVVINFISIVLINGLKKIKVTDVYIVQVLGIKSDRLPYNIEIEIEKKIIIKCFKRCMNDNLIVGIYFY
jgi:hypothetical protein